MILQTASCKQALNMKALEPLSYNDWLVETSTALETHELCLHI